MLTALQVTAIIKLARDLTSDSWLTAKAARNVAAKLQRHDRIARARLAKVTSTPELEELCNVWGPDALRICLDEIEAAAVRV